MTKRVVSSKCFVVIASEYVISIVVICSKGSVVVCSESVVVIEGIIGVGTKNTSWCIVVATICKCVGIKGIVVAIIVVCVEKISSFVIAS